METVLAVAGFDPSGGAGVLGDIKTISFFGCYGVAAVTSITLQNTTGIYGVYNQSGEVTRRQIELLFSDFEIAAVKTGMLPTPETVAAVADLITARQPRYVVVDPVFRSTSGVDLAADDAAAALIRRLVPLASVVTPNVEEAERISGLRISDVEGMKRAGQLILEMGPRVVVVKGGHLEGELVTDVLVDEAGPLTISTKRVHSNNTHGTGCAFASALACLLVRGFSARDASAIAKQYVGEAIRTAPGLGQGLGPLNHRPAGFELPVSPAKR